MENVLKSLTFYFVNVIMGEDSIQKATEFRRGP